jgi:hypothetical protein
MKGKKEFIILAAIIIAAVAYLVLRQTDREQYQLPQVAELSRKDISKIEITGPDAPNRDKAIVIQRKGDKWRLLPKDYPADPKKIDRILDTVSGLKLTAMVSESKNDQRYDLGPKKRIQVKAWSGQDLRRDFILGKAANTFRHTFVKIAGDNRVFHAENNFRDQFEVTVDQLRDKTVLAFKSDEISAFSITKDGNTTQFKKKEIANKTDQSKPEAEKKAPVSSRKPSQWITDADKPADPVKIQSFLTALSDLKCKTFINDRTKTDRTDPVISITLSGPKTYQLSLFAHDKKEGDTPLWQGQSSENIYPFLLSDWKARDIIKGPLDLMPGKPESEKAANNN